MIRKATDSVRRGSTRGQPRSISRHNSRHGRPRGKPDWSPRRPDRSSQKPESPAAPVVVLVEHRDGVFDHLRLGFTTAGFSVTRAKNSAEAVKYFVSETASLLVVNADVPEESPWLLAAKLRLTHPMARIWVYTRQLSTLDLAAANLLAIEELMEHHGKPVQLESKLLDRLGVSTNTALPRPGNLGPGNSGPGNPIQLEPVVATVHGVS